MRPKLVENLDKIAAEVARSLGRPLGAGFFRFDGLICPSGNLRPGAENLSSPASKNISLFPKPKSDVSMVRSVPARGAFRDRTFGTILGLVLAAVLLWLHPSGLALAGCIVVLQ